MQSLVPRPNPISATLGNLALAQLSIKNLGYELARSLTQSSLAASHEILPAPIHAGLSSKATTQADIENPWLWYWCQQLHAKVIYHRKIWELAYVLQVLWENGMLEPGRRAIGFGCGEEPIASLLTAMGIDVTITDQGIDAAEKSGWLATSEHTSSLDLAHHPEIVDRQTFDRHASLRSVDMNAIDPDLADYDFCWSICAYEHLGSIRNGQDFVVNSMKVLKPGGIAVHTTEFNLDDTRPTHEGVTTVLFQRKHFEQIAERLRSAGDFPAALDFDTGDGPIDTFVDLPPYSFEAHEYLRALELGKSERVAHLKLAVSGYPSTCFGLWARRGG
ncbi:hypothetical protein D3876_11875 [Sphingomonas cavernae]|uniref:Class I SAM-dependent methyltransferase n=2 Tax=Sphingomonas cavernae TaxID=2320861 RepID=A0A418WLM4_9SPHN|nr:hypothetical protein D3876_11875 [Sphingomonas cavernae]